jgi:hypothetical protein
MRRIFGAPLPPRRLEPKKVGSGHVLYVVQRGSKTASKAAENSGQSPGNLHCAGHLSKKFSHVFDVERTNTAHPMAHVPDLRGRPGSEARNDHE